MCRSQFGVHTLQADTLFDFHSLQAYVCLPIYPRTQSFDDTYSPHGATDAPSRTRDVSRFDLRQESQNARMKSKKMKSSAVLAGLLNSRMKTKKTKSSAVLDGLLNSRMKTKKT
jgi:hypothetical protein